MYKEVNSKMQMHSRELLLASPQKKISFWLKKYKNLATVMRYMPATEGKLLQISIAQENDPVCAEIKSMSWKGGLPLCHTIRYSALTGKTVIT
jgi:hypothetical protein